MASDELTRLLLAAVFWIAIHLGIAGTDLRNSLIARLGANAWRGLFSLLSVIGLTWLIFDWRAALARFQASGIAPLWEIDARFHWASVILMIPAVLLFVCAITTRSPTAVGGEALLEKPDAVRGVLRITRHPMLWSFALWAFAHLLSNPQLPSVLFFGAFLLVAAAGTRSIDRKRALASGPAWHKFTAATSNIPFVAILTGRNHLALGEIGGIRLAVAAAAWLGLILLHGYLLDKPIFG